MPTVFAHPRELLGAVGRDLGASEWLAIDQERIDTFAEATGDHQWIHVDPVKAKEGPFGSTIAHGYLTLSLVNLFLPQLLEVRGTSMGVNVGADRLRFPAPVPVGSRVRGRGEVLEAEETKDGGVQVKVRVAVEVEGGERPACVVDTLSRFYPADDAHGEERGA
ncbi:MAG: MaoC family dehydratase [Myxococcota bacterium]|nr:MaoC family dehydratase [Myxococcota bacterium]